MRRREADAQALAQALVGYLSVGRLALSVEEFAQALGLSAWTVHERSERKGVTGMRLVAAYEGPARGLPEGLDVLARTGARVMVWGWRRAARVLGGPGRVWQDAGDEWYAEWSLPDGVRVLAPVKGEDLDTVLELWPGVEVLTTA